MSFLYGLTEGKFFNLIHLATKRAHDLKPVKSEHLRRHVLHKQLMRKLNASNVIQEAIFDRDDARDLDESFDETIYSPEIQQAFRELDALGTKRRIPFTVQQNIHDRLSAPDLYFPDDVDDDDEEATEVNNNNKSSFVNNHKRKADNSNNTNKSSNECNFIEGNPAKKRPRKN